MSINDMYDALESLDVAESWSEAFRLNEAEKPRGRRR